MSEKLAMRYPNLVNIEDHENLTPLLRAILMNEFTLATLMMEKCNGNIYHTNRKGYNVMHMAVMQKNVDAINFLISRKFDPHREEFYDEHDGCDFVVKFGLLHHFKSNYFTKNCKLHNKKLRQPCPVKPKPHPNDEIDEKNYYEKSDKEKLLENMEKLDIALTASVLAKPFAEGERTNNDRK